MADPPPDVVAGQVVVGEEAVDVLTEVARDDRRDLGVENDPQAGRADVEPHRALAAGIEPAAAVEDLDPALALGPADDDGRGAVTEKPARDEVGHAHVVGLDGEGAQLDGDEDRDVVGMPQEVVVQARDAGRARDAAEAEERDPLDVLAQPDDRGDAGVERRDGEPRHRRRDDEVDVRGGETGGLEGVLERRRPEGHRVLEEEVVGLVEPGEGLVLVQRQGEVALGDTGVAVDRAQQALAHGTTRADDAGEGVGDLSLVMAMGREGRTDGQQAGVHVSLASDRGVLATVIGPRGSRRP